MTGESFKPNDAAFVVDPYPALAELRESAPLVWSEDFDFWLVTRHAEVLACQRDRRLGRVTGGHAAPNDLRPIKTLQTISDWTPYYDVERHSLLMLEPPEHTRIRSLVSRAFTPKRIRELRPAIEQTAETMSTSLDPSGFDLIADFAQPFSIRVIAKLLGAPLDSVDQLLAWSHAIVKMYELDPTEQQAEAAIRASGEFAEWVGELVAQRRREPTDDLITALGLAETEEGRLTLPEIVSTVILLLNAGHEATVNTMGNGMTAIVRNDSWDQVVSGAVSSEVAVEEMLRWDAPLQLFERWVLQDGFELAGQPIRAGSKLAMLFGAANRDPRVFENPYRFEVGRGDRNHITFGAGTHFCLGAPLARLELDIAVNELASRFPNLTLTSDPERVPAFVIRGYQAVNLTTET